ncbi:peptidoglycan-binding protein [Streptacidiphilus sp. NEAU-YB345]|uniref:Peptidoglycan-binding protein n=2 Tax=Streptacidiphilus fuscans TaxID=2789292 RepID=A0A931FBV7_9ACTN|nr:peptidoglycan-binding protein [Streptacidiphilus fuscans]
MRRLRVSAGLLVATAAMAVAGAPMAHASGNESPQYWNPICLAHGSQNWTVDGGTIPVPTEQLQYGNPYGTADCVEFLQALLGIPEDGSFGPQTNAAVRSFQQANLVRGYCGPVDGIVGPRTWFCLMAQN